MYNDYVLVDLHMYDEVVNHAFLYKNECVSFFLGAFSAVL